MDQIEELEDVEMYKKRKNGSQSEEEKKQGEEELAKKKEAEEALKRKEEALRQKEEEISSLNQEINSFFKRANQMDLLKKHIQIQQNSDNLFSQLDELESLIAKK
mmetsp:Transcript_3579/g.6077  ORF Transcript_3579/g.6077 Transcript_3579/m.6077 type:complete len:105 (-) Transcript_3579:19-333(-)